ncbi:MAG TPA: hypothetical protein VMB34_05100, partial [Acetobacteraceae bacterium]|nr:hypothetical protein [Acetobacteraceae bacterium]
GGRPVRSRVFRVERAPWGDADAARVPVAVEYALRRISTPDDVANGPLLVPRARSRQITGQDLAIDGGQVI